MLWFFYQLTTSLSSNCSIYRAPEVWALNSRLHCGFLKFWPRLHSLSRPESVVATEFYHRSLLQHAVVYRDLLPVLLLGFSLDKVSLVAIVLFSSTYSFCRDKVSYVVLWLFNNMSCKVCRSICSMSRQRQSYMWLLE